MKFKRNIKLETLRWCVSHSAEEIIKELESTEEQDRQNYEKEFIKQLNKI